MGHKAEIKILIPFLTLLLCINLEGAPRDCKPILKSLSRKASPNTKTKSIADLKNPAYVKEEVYDLARKLETKFEQFIKFKKESPPIRSIDREVAKSGISNDGIFRVTLEDGRKKILKISVVHYKDPRDAWNDPVPHDIPAVVIIQNKLAEFGIAPQVHGILLWPQLKKFKDRFKEVAPWFVGQRNRTEGSVLCGILMDEIPGAWNLKENRPPKGFVFDWNQQTIERRIAAVMRAIDTLQIQIIDQQIAIDKYGNVGAIDLDHSQFVPNRLLNSDPTPKIGRVRDYLNEKRREDKRLRENLVPNSLIRGRRFNINRSGKSR